MYCENCKEVTFHWISDLESDEDHNKLKIKECTKNI